VASAGPGWQLEGFLERLDAWSEREGANVSDDVRIAATAWILTRMDDPYQGVQREQGFDNLWFGAVPGSHDGKGHVVVCSYWIEETEHVVRCDNFGLLSWPV